MTDRACAPAAQRNAAPILEVLQRELREHERVLEIGSGTGQHAVYFATALPHLQWQTSDLAESHGDITGWIRDSGVLNVHAPLLLDVLHADVEPASYDAAYSSNTAHIMSVEAVTRMFALVGALLRPRGIFCLYGPFRIGGEFNTPSNAQFDASLRRGDSHMGIRDLEMLDELARESGMQRESLYAMPANNFLVVWSKEALQ